MRAVTLLAARSTVDKIAKEGWLEFDAVVATPDMMRFVGRVGRILGPRGLMPNPKTGTVTFDVAKAVSEVKAGKVEFRVDKGAVIHSPVGKLRFDVGKLTENAETLISAVIKARPQAAKGAIFGESDDLLHHESVIDA